MFVDIARVDLKAGRGGDGAVAFRREKYEPAGGPAGGDGGNGGNIYIIADEGTRTLGDYHYKRYYHAENGEPGRNKGQFGKAGEDLYLYVPLGTLIKDAETNTVIYDMKEPGEEFLICKGGAGGKGNRRFKSSTRQAPRFAEPGKQGEEKAILLEIKLISDVGLVGLPNVGKSTILSILSNARPKIDNYHFTTLIPNLGVVDLGDGNSFVLADVPGMIEGASKGIGLGLEFLKHLERTGLLVHVIDMSGSEGRDPIDDYLLIREELKGYDKRLDERKEIIVANKKDLPGFDKNIKDFKKEFPELEIIEISAATTENVNVLKNKIWESLKDIDFDYEYFDEDYVEPEVEEAEPFTIEKSGEFYIVEGPFVDDLVYRTNFEKDASIKHFQKVLADQGIVEKLRELGAEDGDTVILGDLEFEFYS